MSTKRSREGAAQVWQTGARELSRLPSSPDREAFTRPVEIIVASLPPRRDSLA